MRIALALTLMLTVLGDATSAKERVRSGLEIGDRAPATDAEMKNALDGGMTTIAKAAGEKGTLAEVSSMILIAEGAEKPPADHSR